MSVVSGKTLIDNAHAALAQPLKFGDDAQICANRFLRRVREYYEHLRECGRCQNHEECGGMELDPDVEIAAWALVTGESSE